MSTSFGETFLPSKNMVFAIGDVIHLSVLGKSIIVLNSEEAARELLDKRSAIYSDRPNFPAYQL